MIHALHTETRELLEAYALQHFRNEVWEAVLHNASFNLPDTTVVRIEQRVLADAQELISRLTAARLRDPRYMNIMITDAISQTKDLLRKAAAQQARNQQAKNKS